MRPSQQEAAGEGEQITTAARHHVQVDVMHRLEGRFTVVEYEIRAVGAEIAAPQRLCDAMAHAEQVRAQFGVEFVEVGGMAFRNHQGVSPGDRPDVEEGVRALVLVDPCRRRVARDDPAEDTATHHADITA